MMSLEQLTQPSLWETFDLKQYLTSRSLKLCKVNTSHNQIHFGWEFGEKKNS